MSWRKNKMANELKENGYSELTAVDVSKLPSLITEQINSLGALEAKVNNALSKAEEARNAAERANSKSIGWFNKGTKDAVYSLQSATKDLADAQYLSADTQKVILQYQAKLAEISKYLFALGVYNIAANRMVVRELELKLKNGSLSKGKVSELAQQEILNVIKQLKAQEDIMLKQEKMTDKIKEHQKLINQQQTILEYNKKVDSEHEKLIEQLKSYDDKQDELINKLMSEDDEQDKLLEKHSQTDEKHEKLISELMSSDDKQDELINKMMSVDNEQDKLLEKHSQTDEKHEELINKLMSSDDKQDELINKMMSVDDEQDKLLEKHEEKDHEFEIKIEELESEIRELKENCENLEKNKTNNKLTYVLLGLVVISLICSLIQFM